MSRALPGAIDLLEREGTRVQEHKLANGMTVLIAERHLDPVVAVMLWYKVGARNETEREAGVSHFLEHMMFKGSSKFGKGAIDHVTTLLGGSNNAFTTADHTAYWFELASDRWEKALEIEADRMRNLALDAREFEAEKSVVLEELAMGEDDPWRNLTQEVQATVFPRHPYRRPVIGYADTLQPLAVEEMRDYYRRFYHPGNATLVVCGDVDAAEALALVRQHFEALPAGPERAGADTLRPKHAEPKGERRLTVTWDDPAQRLCMAWPTVAVGEKDDHVLDVVSTLLTGGRLSRLYRSLVLEKKLAASVSTHNDARCEGGCFWLFAELPQGGQAAALERAVDAELARLADERVSAKELERVRRTILAGDAYDRETISDLAEEIGEFAVDTHWRQAFEAVDAIKAVTAADIQACARRLLGKQRRVTGWSVPKNPPAPARKARRTSQRRRAQPARARKGKR